MRGKSIVKMCSSAHGRFTLALCCLWRLSGKAITIFTVKLTEKKAERKKQEERQEQLYT